MLSVPLYQRQYYSLRSFATKASASILAGTAPYHNLYVFLHSLKPPESFPSVIPSPLYKALQLKLKPFHGLVNFSWTPDQRSDSLIDQISDKEEESYSATAFSVNGHPLEIDRLSLSNLDQVVQHITTQASGTRIDRGDLIYIYVCTHGARDCRCGETGGQVARTLREEIDKRNLSSLVKLGQTTHVGGHQYAANVLIYPRGEWLGNVTPQDVPSVLDAILRLPRQNWSLRHMPPLLPSHWRGRMGLEKEQQINLHTAT